MRAVALSTAAAVLLVVVYLALGGASYAPAKVADPCDTREWRNPQGAQRVLEQIVLSALDGAACDLGATREEVVLALANDDKRRAFAREHNVTQERLEEVVRTGLLRAIDDAEAADALGSTTADLLRGLVPRIPIGGLLDLLDRLSGF
jgi:hypothetical protein